MSTILVMAIAAAVAAESVTATKSTSPNATTTMPTMACGTWSARYERHLPGICVCNVTGPCDTITDAYHKLPPTHVGIFETSMAGARLTYSTRALDDANSTSSSSPSWTLVVDPATAYQEILGFGGAFTDATAINVHKLPPVLQERLLEAYFGNAGLAYSLGRVPIGSTDFSESVYSYNPTVDDLEMTNFSIAMDLSNKTHKIALLRRALNMTEVAARNLSLFASSWAPPPWMTRENRVENCHIKGDPGGLYWRALALYYAKFFDAYAAEGIRFWAMTTQNEPIQQPLAPKFWQQLRFTDAIERDFIKRDLGPVLRERHPSIQIIIHDDQKDTMVTWNASLADPEARAFVAGIGVHWYKNLDFLVDNAGNFEELAAFHALHPDLFILATEACAGSYPDGIGTGAGTKLLEPEMTWKRGENYARDIIGDLAHFAGGWVDWNMVLDTTGGPTWVENFVDAPILIDERGRQEFYKQPMYYVLGHFAKFVVPGSRRIALNTSNTTAQQQEPAMLAKIDRVAFRTPSRQVVVVLSNRNIEPVTLRLSEAGAERGVTVTIPGNALHTILFPPDSSSPPQRDNGTPATRNGASRSSPWAARVPATVVGALLLCAFAR